MLGSNCTGALLEKLWCRESMGRLIGYMFVSLLPNGVFCNFYSVMCLTESIRLA